jgi:outer membrane protein
MKLRKGSAVWAAVGLLVACVFITVPRAELKVGFINSEKIFAEYEGTKEAQDKFNKEVAKWEQEATDRQKEMKDLKDQLEKQSLLLSSERKKEIEDQYQVKLAEYQKFLQSKFGQEGDAVKKNEDLTKPIVEKINKILEQIAKTENYDFIFDARVGGLVFAKPGYDLTERVLAALNKEK